MRRQFNKPILELPFPLLPIHLLWINLVTGGFSALCLATNPIEKDVMKHRPYHRSTRIGDKAFFSTMLYTAFVTAAVALGVCLDMLQTGPLATAQSYAFSVLVFAELFRAFGARSEAKVVWKIPFFSNLKLVKNDLEYLINVAWLNSTQVLALIQ